MFPTQRSRAFLSKAKGQKARNVYTQAYAALTHELNLALGTDVPFLIEHQPVDTKKKIVPKRSSPKVKTEAQILSEELLGNDSLGG